MVAAVVAAPSPSAAAALQPALPLQQDTTTTHYNPHCHSSKILQLHTTTRTATAARYYNYTLQPALPQQQDTATTHYNPHCHSRALTLQLQELTRTSLPHDRGQDAVSPLVGVEVKLPVQLAQGQRLGVQWELLHNKGQRSMGTPAQHGSEVNGNSHTRVGGVYGVPWELLHKGQRCVWGQWELLHNKGQGSVWGQWELLHNKGQGSVWGQWELLHKVRGQWELLNN